MSISKNNPNIQLKSIYRLGLYLKKDQNKKTMKQKMSAIEHAQMQCSVMERKGKNIRRH